MAKKKKSFEEAVEETLEEAEKQKAQKEQKEQSGEVAEEDPAEVEEETGPEPVGEDGEPDEKKDPKDEKIAELNDKVVRQMAEFDNFRKRSEKEKHEMFASGEKAVIEAILPVVDNFERALGMAGADENKKADPFMEGMEKVYKQLMDELEKLGVKPIEALGADFDPNIHNAVMQEETEEYESGKVCKELQKGYMLNDSVVRHSMVSVAQ
ncbi:MAG: nucleotide exchange factor GrpE [Lachnospiraceae bacterium]|nr:nucleotide exchange factor GrpE [Lachnospiraceae bacterium]